MITYRPLNSVDFNNALYDWLLIAETRKAKPDLTPYRDTKGYISIGVGFNLNKSNLDVRDEILDELFFKPNGKLNDNAMLQVTVIREEVEQILDITYTKANYSDSAFMQQIVKLNNEILQLSNIRNDTGGFAFSKKTFAVTEQECRTITKDLLDNIYTPQLNKIVGTVPDSYENVALMSMLWNGRVYFSNKEGEITNLTYDLKNGIRSDAWYEIRYGSSGVQKAGSVSQGIDPGVPARRYAESERFNLYNKEFTDTTGVSDNDIAEAKDVFSMATYYGKEITEYDKYWLARNKGNYLSDASKKYGITIKPTKDTIGGPGVTGKTAFSVLIGKYVPSIPLQSVWTIKDILVNRDTFPNLAVAENPTVLNPNKDKTFGTLLIDDHIPIPLIRAQLKGGDGNDVLVDDNPVAIHTSWLIGGLGNDYIVCKDPNTDVCIGTIKELNGDTIKGFGGSIPGYTQDSIFVTDLPFSNQIKPSFSNGVLSITDGLNINLAGDNDYAKANFTASARDGGTEVSISDRTTVVFDLTTGRSSNVDGREFLINKSYDIYIILPHPINGATLTQPAQWSAPPIGGGLGPDDTVTMVHSPHTGTYTAPDGRVHKLSPAMQQRTTTTGTFTDKVDMINGTAHRSTWMHYQQWKVHTQITRGYIGYNRPFSLHNITAHLTQQTKVHTTRYITIERRAQYTTHSGQVIRTSKTTRWEPWKSYHTWTKTITARVSLMACPSPAFVSPHTISLNALPAGFLTQQGLV